MRIPLLLLLAIAPLARPVRATPDPAYADLPLAFEENRGQAAPEARFLVRTPDHTIFLTPAETVLVSRTDPGTAPAVLRMQLVGARSDPQLAGLDPSSGSTHYLVGKDPAAWRRNVPSYARVRYQDVYPGIDVVYYGTHAQLEHDFVVAPGADPRRIRLRFTGADTLRIDGHGALVARPHGGGAATRWAKPVVYQMIDGARRLVDGAYVMLGTHDVGFRVGRYDRARPLVIDPLVYLYATYISGGNEYQPRIALREEPDGMGHMLTWAYVSGTAFTADFPTTAGALQRTFNPNSTNVNVSDVFITKLNPSGTGVAYSTYLGGGGGDQALGIAVGADGSAYVTGRTQSIDFPVTPGAPQGTHSPDNGLFAAPNLDAFVARLSPDGSSLIYATYLGGTQDDFGTGIGVDANGYACVAGGTESVPFRTLPDGTNFPVLNPLAPLPTTPLSFLVWAARLDPAGALVYSTIVNGTSGLGGAAVAAGTSGACALVGTTTAVNRGTDDPGNVLPVSGNAFQPHNGACPDPDNPNVNCYGSNDAFVIQLSPTGGLAYGSFHGRDIQESGTAVAVGASGKLYVASVQGGFSDSDGLLAQFDPVAGTRTLFIKFGGSLGDTISGIAVNETMDPNTHAIGGALALIGVTQSPDFPLVMPLKRTGGAFALTYDIALRRIRWSTEIPVSLTGVAIDTHGDAFVAGVAGQDFPTTTGAFQSNAPLSGNPHAIVLKVGRCDDADDDGLCDDWEQHGVSIDPGDGSGPQFIDLPKMGANFQKPDIFVQLDWMDCAVDGGDCATAHNHRLSARGLQEVVDAFYNSPYRSPTGSTGINLHIDQGPTSALTYAPTDTWGALSRARALKHVDMLGSETNNVYDWTAFDAIKTAGFTKTGRAPVFHYAIAAHKFNTDGNGGLSRGISASDFMVTLGDFAGAVGSRQDQATTFMHELGHNLSLHHGGDDGVNFKPDYLSIMNYAFAFDRLTKAGVRNVLDFSRSDGGTLDETKLDEAVGLGASAADYGTRHVCPGGAEKLVITANGPIDWSCNGAIDAGLVGADVNGDGLCIKPGPNGTLDTTPTGDDVVIGKEIWDGPDFTCNSTQAMDDVQEEPLGTVQPEPLAGYDDWSNIQLKGGTIGRAPDAVHDQPMTSDGDPLSKDLKTLLDPPLQPNCTVDGECDDGDDCTVDHCDPQDGCVDATTPGCAPSAVLPTTTTIPGGSSTTTTLPGTCPATGFAGVACVCAGGIAPAECATVPKSIGNVFRAACTTMQRASAATRAKKTQKLTHKAATKFGKALAKATHLGTKHKLSAPCATALATTLDDARQRSLTIAAGL